jgi:hypothetical protein
MTTPAFSTQLEQFNARVLADVALQGRLHQPGGTDEFVALVMQIARDCGTVTLMDGASTLGTGNLVSSTATFTTSTLAFGNHAITAVYNGDATYADSTSSTLTQSVIVVASGHKRRRI